MEVFFNPFEKKFVDIKWLIGNKSFFEGLSVSFEEESELEVASRSFNGLGLLKGGDETKIERESRSGHAGAPCGASVWV